jgi:isoquinoline 1-oxidoreductase beta subunit
MKPQPALNRRGFLKVTYMAGVGMLIGIYLPACNSTPAPPATSASQPTPTPLPTTRLPPTAGPLPTLEGPDTLQPNLFVLLGIDGTVTLTVHRSEMGQGVRTALPMILAEELEADWQSIRVKQGDADGGYGDQLTGGSVSVSNSYGMLRRAGAVGRDLLLTAAAQVWSIAKETVYADHGWVIRRDTGERLAFDYLVPLAASLPVPDGLHVPLKNEYEFRLIGTSQGRLDDPAIVTGAAIFGMDVKVPNMLYAVVAYNPVIGGRIAEFDDRQARAVPGVREVLPTHDGVAVVADNTWSALQGRQALVIDYHDGSNADYSSAADEQSLMGRATAPPGDNELVAYYVVPYLSHSPMEPMNCVADAGADRCVVWAPTQNPQELKQGISQALHLPLEAVTVHVPLIGGGFGRRLFDNHPIPFILEAVQISQELGVPIKLLWTREDDLQHDYYHPLSVTRVSASLDRIASPRSTRLEGERAIPTGPWRSVTNVPEAFARESFIDEYALALKQDPLELRYQLFTSDRARAVLELAADKAGWGFPMPAGYGRGIAYHATWGVTHVAQVAEVSVSGDGRVRVQRVVCAVDCGLVINPGMVEAQMESGIVFGLTAALKAAVSIDHGRVEQSNFSDYPLLRLDETPAIEVHIVPSTQPPSGIGEMSNPVVMPTVANAIFAATGKRIRRLPISSDDLKAA